MKPDKVVMFLQDIAKELETISDARRYEAESAKEGNADLWCMGVVQARAEQVSFMVAAGKVRDLARDFSPKYLKGDT